MSTAWTRQRMTLACALVAPALIVQTIAWISGRASGPAPAAAAPALPAAELPAPVAAQASEDPRVEAALAFYARARANTQNLASPMLVTPIPEPAPSPGVVVHQAPPDVAAVEMPPSLQLTAIISGGQGTMAAINGKVYREGDLVTKGWTIARINGVALTVELANAGGSRITLKQARAGDGD